MQALAYNIHKGEQRERERERMVIHEEWKGKVALWEIKSLHIIFDTHSYWYASKSTMIAHNNIPAMLCHPIYEMLYILLHRKITLEI
jgi:hypothetical protein